jgi:hypothetical protein
VVLLTDSAVCGCFRSGVFASNESEAWRAGARMIPWAQLAVAAGPAVRRCSVMPALCLADLGVCDNGDDFGAMTLSLRSVVS